MTLIHICIDTRTNRSSNGTVGCRTVKNPNDPNRGGGYAASMDNLPEGIMSRFLKVAVWSPKAMLSTGELLVTRLEPCGPSEVGALFHNQSSSIWLLDSAQTQLPTCLETSCLPIAAFRGTTQLNASRYIPNMVILRRNLPALKDSFQHPTCTRDTEILGTHKTQPESRNSNGVAFQDHPTTLQ